MVQEAVSNNFAGGTINNKGRKRWFLSKDSIGWLPIYLRHIREYWHISGSSGVFYQVPIPAGYSLTE
jgi:hypothetical protein